MASKNASSVATLGRGEALGHLPRNLRADRRMRATVARPRRSGAARFPRLVAAIAKRRMNRARSAAPPRPVMPALFMPELAAQLTDQARHLRCCRWTSAATCPAGTPVASLTLRAAWLDSW
jgi:hypothetical protein